MICDGSFWASASMHSTSAIRYSLYPDIFPIVLLLHRLRVPSASQNKQKCQNKRWPISAPCPLGSFITQRWKAASLSLKSPGQSWQIVVWQSISSITRFDTAPVCMNTGGGNLHCCCNLHDFHVGGVDSDGKALQTSSSCRSQPLHGPINFWKSMAPLITWSRWFLHLMKQAGSVPNSVATLWLPLSSTNTITACLNFKL